MAVSRKTQKDVGKFKAKFIGPFTLSQAIWVGIAIILSIFVKLICDAIGVTSEIMVVAIILVAGTCIFFSIEVRGMTRWEYIMLCMDRNLNPSKRLYKTETDFDVMKKEETPSTKTRKDHKPIKGYDEFK